MLYNILALNIKVGSKLNKIGHELIIKFGDRYIGALSYSFSIFMYIWNFLFKRLFQKEIDKISQLPRLRKELNSGYYSLV